MPETWPRLGEGGENMWIDLQILEEYHRSDRPVQCSVCERRYVVGAVIARAYRLDKPVDEQAAEAVCLRRCLEAGPEGMAEILEDTTGWHRIIAQECEELADEGIVAPTLEDFKLLEEIAAL
jgi:hypothetical protein